MGNNKPSLFLNISLMIKTTSPQVKAFAICCLLFLFSLNVFSQVGIGTTNPEESSALDITSTNSGILIPRMTKVQRDDIAGPSGVPATGLMIFQTDNTPGFYYYKGIWKPFGGSSSNTGWDLTGNTGTSPGTNYLGTTDGEKLLFKTNATNSFEITTNRRLRAYENGTAALPVYSWNGAVGQKMGLYKYAYTGKNWNNANITGEVMGISTDGKERMRFLDRGQIEVNRTTQPYTDLRNQFSVYASNTGTQNRGIYVISYGSTGTGVFVTNEDGGAGVNATSRLDNGTGVSGYNNDGNGVGVFGGSGSNSNWGTGVHGNSVKGAGVFGEST